LQIEVNILRYVAHHPEAKDTAEGIAQWWLLGSRTKASVAEVKAGLDCLVAQGRLAAERQADGNVYYCRLKAPDRRTKFVRTLGTTSRRKLNQGDDSQRSNQPRQR
jgi:uncharacterized membrane protein